MRGAILLAGLLVGWFGSTVAAEPPPVVVSLDSGFQFLYDLDFDHAHQAFAAWQQQYPDNPMGPACEAAALLFSEFNRLGVLEAQFYQDDKAFEKRQQFAADPGLRDRFNAALDRAENGALARLGKDAKNRDALFAMTMASGLRADYAALIEKHNLASLHFTKQATGWAQQLLVVDPNCYDAHLATGVSQYIVGSMSAPVRWLVRLGGVSGDKQAGMRELQVTADRGQYLAPFARILLAIAYVREKDKPRAREILLALQNDFPQNPLFAREISRLDAQR
ncbi:MAG TPA: hypothetical protein VKR57_11280 [Terriglobales bacterium]|jgi:hypothetical protein|nr:hypothetical protein [Terriglobales bacterium]